MLAQNEAIMIYSPMKFDVKNLFRLTKKENIVDGFFDLQVRLTDKEKSKLTEQERVATTVFDRIGIRDPETVVKMIEDSRIIFCQNPNPELSTENAIDFFAGNIANVGRGVSLTVFDGSSVFNFSQVDGRPVIPSRAT